MADTERQELASITAFYYAIEKGANLGTLQEPAINLQDRDEELYQALLSVYSDMETRWYRAFIKQAIVFIDWLGHRQGSTDTSYKYGRFGSNSIDSIPSNKTSTIGYWMWDNFKKHKKKIMWIYSKKR